MIAIARDLVLFPNIQRPPVRIHHDRHSSFVTKSLGLGPSLGRTIDGRNETRPRSLLIAYRHSGQPPGMSRTRLRGQLTLQGWAIDNPKGTLAEASWRGRRGISFLGFGDLEPWSFPGR